MRNIVRVLRLKMPMQAQNIGECIYKRRKRLNISQVDLAEMSGVSLRTINAIERGEANPTVDVLSKVLAPLGLVISLQERVIHE